MLTRCALAPLLRAVWLSIGRTIEKHFPETLGALCIVGAPPGAEWVLERLKNFMNESVGRKLEMHGGDPRPPLLRLLPPDVIPPELLDEFPFVGRVEGDDPRYVGDREVQGNVWSRDR